MRRSPWLIPGGVLLALAAAHAAYWFWTEGQLQAGLADWLAMRRAEGWVATGGPPESGGWPFAATLTILAPSLSGGAPAIPGGLAWTAERVTLRIPLFDPHALSIGPVGPQHLRVADSPEIAAMADRIALEIPLEADAAPHTADLRADNLRLGLSGGPHPDKTATIALLTLHLDLNPAVAQAGEPATALTLDTDAIDLPPGTRWPLGSRISSFSLAGSLDGPIPDVPDLAQRAAAWRDAGGTVAINRLTLGWGPLGLSASGSLALDDQLQPQGTANARMVGFADALDLLATNGVLTPRAATAVKAVLALIANPAGEANGGQPQVEVPLTLHNGIVSMRQFPLARVPPLVWPNRGQ